MNERSKDMDGVMARLDGIEERNGGLRRQNRLLRAVAALSVLVLATLLFTGAVRNQAVEVKAERFVLVDSQGRGRALMTTSGNNGTPALMLYDSNGDIRIMLAIEGDEPCLQFLSKDGKLDAALSVVGDRRTLLLKDENGKLRAALDVSKNGPRLRLLDEKGEALWSAPE